MLEFPPKERPVSRNRAGGCWTNYVSQTSFYIKILCPEGPPQFNRLLPAKRIKPYLLTGSGLALQILACGYRTPWTLSVSRDPRHTLPLMFVHRPPIQRLRDISSSSLNTPESHTKAWTADSQIWRAGHLGGAAVLGILGVHLLHHQGQVLAALTWNLFFFFMFPPSPPPKKKTVK